MLEIKNSDIQIGMIGCGNMGEAILKRLLKSKIAYCNQIAVTTRTTKRQHYLAQTYGIKSATTAHIYAQSNIIILAVKPQQFASVPSATMSSDTVVLSLMAGISTATLKQHFKDALIARAMPNLGFSSGNGVTGLFRANKSGWSTLQAESLHILMASGGMVVDLQNEAKLDAITAISGSGPAYFMWFAEQLIATAHDLGFTEPQAAALVRQTLIGTASLLSNSNSHIADLRQQVTSKGGTTEAAIIAFNKQKLGQSIDMGVKTAVKRSRELADQ